MLLEPRFLVADEPVSMLDASVRVEVLKLLRSLQEKRHLAVIYITHDLSTVRYFSHRIFVMYAGQIVEKAKAAGIPVIFFNRAVEGDEDEGYLGALVHTIYGNAKGNSVIVSRG